MWRSRGGGGCDTHRFSAILKLYMCLIEGLGEGGRKVCYITRQWVSGDKRGKRNMLMRWKDKG